MKTTTTKLFFSLAIGFLASGLVLAGTLDPPGPMAPTMVTLQQIYDAAQRPGCFNKNPAGLRFVDCGNGTVQDTQTGLIWLKNANCLPVGGRDWASANRRAAKLAEGTADGSICGLTDGSKAGAWRLPTKAEWEALVLAYPSPCNPALPGPSGSGCYSASPWAIGVQSNMYWSSTSYADNPGRAWQVYLNDGYVESGGKTGTRYVWPVRGGQWGTSTLGFFRGVQGERMSSENIVARYAELKREASGKDASNGAV